METYEDYLKEQGNSQNTIAGKLNIIRHFTDWLQRNNSSVETFTYTQMMYYLRSQRKREITQRSIQQRTGYIKQYLNWLVKTGDITHNPILAISIQGVKRQRLYHIIEPEELHKIPEQYETERETKVVAQHCPPQELNQLARKRNKVLLGLFIYQGISSHDLSNIKTQHVHIKKGLITIPGARRINERTLKLEAAQLFELHEYITIVRPELLQRNHTSSDQLFVTKQNGKHIANTLQCIIREIKKQHPAVISFKQIRASVISNWLKHYNIRKVQYMAGHKYISSTEQYQQHNIEDLQQAINTQMPVPSIS